MFQKVASLNFQNSLKLKVSVIYFPDSTCIVTFLNVLTAIFFLSVILVKKMQLALEKKQLIGCPQLKGFSPFQSSGASHLVPLVSLEFETTFVSLCYVFKNFLILNFTNYALKLKLIKGIVIRERDTNLKNPGKKHLSFLSLQRVCVLLFLLLNIYCIGQI